MKVELEANNLPEAFRLTMFIRNTTYHKVCKELGITYSKLWWIAHGNIKRVDISTLVKLYDFLQVTEGEFVQLLRDTKTTSTESE